MTREEFIQDAMLRIIGNVKPMDATNENLCNDIIRFVDKITKSVYGPTDLEVEIQNMLLEKKLYLCDISVRALNQAHSIGIETVGDLVENGRGAFTRKTQIELEEFLERSGLSFK